MIEIIFNGRGGQGAVTASQILATAAFSEGMFAQAFPNFGPDRRGAPVKAFVRIDDNPIVDRSPINNADYVVLLDPNLFKMFNPLDQLKKAGQAILNFSDRHIKQYFLMLSKVENCFCIDASTISEQVYGKTSIPITNVAMLGALAKASSIVALDSIITILDSFFPPKGSEKAAVTARTAYKEVMGVRG